MQLLFLEPAQKELDEAVQWYDIINPALAQLFLDEVHRGTNLICKHPDAWHAMGKGFRRYRFTRFPYGLIYTRVQIETIDTLLIVALGHLHRKPNYWQSRTKRPPNQSAQ